MVTIFREQLGLQFMIYASSFSTRREDFLEQRLFFSSLYLLSCNKNAPCVCLLQVNCKWDNPIKTILETRTGYLHGQTKHLWYCQEAAGDLSPGNPTSESFITHGLWNLGQLMILQTLIFFFFLKAITELMNHWTLYQKPYYTLAKWIYIKKKKKP